MYWKMLLFISALCYQNTWSINLGFFTWFSFKTCTWAFLSYCLGLLKLMVRWRWLRINTHLIWSRFTLGFSVTIPADAFSWFFALLTCYGVQSLVPMTKLRLFVPFMFFSCHCRLRSPNDAHGWQPIRVVFLSSWSSKRRVGALCCVALWAKGPMLLQETSLLRALWPLTLWLCFVWVLYLLDVFPSLRVYMLSCICVHIIVFYIIFSPSNLFSFALWYVRLSNQAGVRVSQQS